MNALDYITYAEYLETEHWQFIRQAALWHADDRCQVCGTSAGLEVHCRSYERLGAERSEDLVVLCRRCHELYSQDEALRLGAKGK